MSKIPENPITGEKNVDLALEKFDPTLPENPVAILLKRYKNKGQRRFRLERFSEIYQGTFLK